MIRKKTHTPYLERDISWMYFNRRILQEAVRPHVPLLERLVFLGIYSNNLDEFFRVRVATQGRVADCKDKSASRESGKARKLMKELFRLNSQYTLDYVEALNQLGEELRAENIFLVNDQQVTRDQYEFICSYYKEKLNGFIIPIWFSAIKQFDMETDENIYLAVKMSQKVDGTSYDYAFLGLPIGLCGRFVRLPDADGKSYIMYVDDVIRCCLPLVFEGLGYTDFEAYAFKFTRDAEMEIDNDLRNGTMQNISKGIKSRKRGEPLRVIYDSAMPRDLLKRVLNKLELDTRDTLLATGRYQNHRDLMSFPDCGRKDLKYPAWVPVLKKELDGPESLLEKIQQKDRFIHVPYHSFDSYIRVLQEAAVSKQVHSIKISLYRLAKESKVVKALIGAARNGKKVTVVIELLARFDEASNIGWSNRMQDAGIKVIFGVEGLKVHSKITYIGMKSGLDIACISTGNFHEGNARMYTDCMLMTASKRIVQDVHSVFGFIERPYSQVRFKELLVSPNEMKRKFINLINKEIKNKKVGLPAYIKVKINHITDPTIVDKLYEAAEEGVDVDLLVRGNCSLVPDSLFVSQHMRISGIIDRYLEHSRIFIFAAGGEEKIFMGSADWMPRNLNNRVEVITPVYDKEVQEELRRIVDYGLKDTMQARIVDGKGTNRLKDLSAEVPFRSQEELYKWYRSENEKK